MGNSIILGFFVHIFLRLKGYYNQSYTKVLVESLQRRFNNSKEESAIISTLSAKSRLSKLWKSSLFYRLIVYPFALIRGLINKKYDSIERIVMQSSILSRTKLILSNLLNYSIRSYGILLFALFTTETVLWVLLQVNDIKYLVLRASFILLSVIMLFFDIPIAALFKGSYVFGLIEGAFVDKQKQYDSQNSKSAHAKGLLLLAVIGAGLGLLAYFLPLKSMALAMAGIFVVVLVLWRFEVGVYAAAGFAAIIQTTPLLLLIGLTLVSFMLKWIQGKAEKYRATPIDALVIMFFTILIYSTGTSYFIKNSVSVLVIHSLFIALYFVITRTINTKHRLYLLVLFLIISAALVSLYGVYQYYTGAVSSAAWIDKDMFGDIQTRVGSTFNNPNILGEYLIMIIPLVFAMLWYKKKPFYKLIFMGMLAIMGVCMILTFSRGAWLGLLLAVVAFFVVKDKRLLALLLIGLLMLPFVLPESIINRFTSIGNLQDTSSSYRMSILLGSLRMAQDYWISGIGLGSQAFEAIYPKYSLAAAYAHHSHNIYLQVLLEMGVAGALIFSLIIIVFIRAMLAHQGRSKDKFLAAIMIAACAGMAGYLLQGVVENIWYNYRVLLTFWVLLAVGMCALRIDEGEIGADD